MSAGRDIDREAAAADDLDLPFIDCHHHIWDPLDDSHPWLIREPMMPFRYGDYSSIRGRYLPEHYLDDAGAHRVAAHVTMEGEWNEDGPVAETRWLAGVFAKHPDYMAHIARAFLDRDDVAGELAGHAAYPFVKGIRHKPTAAQSPRSVERSAPGSMSDPNWQRGYALLRAHGLHFELQAPWWHAGELLGLIDRFPETPVVINHAFLPSERSPAALDGWRTALAETAKAPNVSLKISGIGIAGKPWSLDDNRRITFDCIDAFGADRCMFASNFPVDRLTGSFDTIIGGFKAATRDLPRAERIKLFHDNAILFYRLGGISQLASSEA